MAAVTRRGRRTGPTLIKKKLCSSRGIKPRPSDLHSAALLVSYTELEVDHHYVHMRKAFVNARICSDV